MSIPTRRGDAQRLSKLRSLILNKRARLTNELSGTSGGIYIGRKLKAFDIHSKNSHFPNKEG
ncbi:hypothetical protein [Corynebacterium resistens]|uniref:hypothetical protein n=1 Tax=Corynebacterium resistens TaxID=258224 RepID=UPI0001E289AC|nr:hypothetical protein [Corynebacterium resistens]